ncbi:MAG: hypothetical protein CM15mV89_0170 [Caudoviricetes sp.]|nr:MAG: hypothetical protein CM15mV89_0170 [Caudoviricetes sp.]
MIYLKDFFKSSQSSPSLAGSIQNSSLSRSSFFLVPVSTLGLPLPSVVPSDITTCLCLPSTPPSSPSLSTIGANTSSVFTQVLNLTLSSGIQS